MTTYQREKSFQKSIRSIILAILVLVTITSCVQINKLDEEDPTHSQKIDISSDNETINTSHQSLSDFKDALNNKDFDDAISIYITIEGDDLEEANEAITESVEEIRQKYKREEIDYDFAMSEIEKYDRFTLESVEQAKEDIRNDNLNADAIYSATGCFGSKMYLVALLQIKDIDETSRYFPYAENIRAICRGGLRSEMESYFPELEKAFNYSEIVEYLKNAIECVPDDEYLQEQLIYYSEREQKTKKLRQMLEEGEFEEILCQGDEYYVVKKTYDQYDGFFVMVGIINEDGNWIQEISGNNEFAKAFSDASKKRDLNGRSPTLNSTNFAYFGDGVFISSLGVEIDCPGYSYRVGTAESVSGKGLTCYIWDVVKNISFTCDATNLSPICDGYMLMYNSDRYNSNFYSLSKTGGKKELPCKYSSTWGVGYPAFSDGVFFAEGKFFDIQGNIVLDISQYNLYGREYGDKRNAPYFEDGKCKIVFRNNGGSLFYAIIDKDGTFLEGPNPYEE